MSKVKVVIVDDHALVRHGLQLILNSAPNTLVVGEGSSGDEAIELAEQLHPDVMLLDVHMPKGIDGITAARHIHESNPSVRVLMLTMFDDEVHVEKMLAASVSGILFKHDDSTEILEAIQSGSPRSPYLPKRISGEVRERLMHNKFHSESVHPALSTRETEILVYISNGFTNKEIATRLHISVKTVETHRANIMRRLALKTRAELVEYALKNGYIQSVSSPPNALL
jgi:two-component system response regulator NreC